MNQISYLTHKIMLQRELVSLLRAAGEKVTEVKYTVEGNKHAKELYTIRMASGDIYSIDVTGLMPISSAAKVINYMSHRQEEVNADHL